MGDGCHWLTALLPTPRGWQKAMFRMQVWLCGLPLPIYNPFLAPHSLWGPVQSSPKDLPVSGLLQLSMPIRNTQTPSHVSIPLNTLWFPKGLKTTQPGSDLEYREAVVLSLWPQGLQWPAGHGVVQGEGFEPKPRPELEGMLTGRAKILRRNFGLTLPHT